MTANERVLWLIVAVLTASHLASLFFAPIDGHDAGLHLAWLQGYSQVANWSDWLPRWIPTALRGLGAPIFDHYPPLTYLIGSIIYGVTGLASATGLFRAVALAAYALSMVAMYWYGRSEFRLDARLASLVALLYAFNPYRFHTLFTRSALPEDLAFVWIPIICLSASKILKRESFSWPLLLGLSLGLLVLTNVPIAIVTSIALVVYALHSIRDRTVILSFSVAAVLALGVSAAFVLPALATNSQFNALGLLHPGEHSPLLEALTSGYIQNRIQLPIVFLFTGLAFLQAWRSRSRPPAALSVLAIFLVLELPFLFRIVSALIPPLALIQFPWRANPVIFALLIPIFVQMITLDRSTRMSLTVLGVSALVVVGVCIATLGGFRVGVHSSEDDIRPEYSPQHSSVSPERILERMTAEADGLSTYSRARAGMIRIQTPSAKEQQLTRLDSGSNELRMKLYYWPALTAVINGKAVAMTPDSLGLATITLPAGRATARISVAHSNLERWSEVISLFSAGLSIIAISGIAMLRSAKDKKRGTNQQSQQRPIESHAEA